VIQIPARRGDEGRTRNCIPNPGGGLIRKVHTRVPGRARFMVAALYRSERVRHRLEAGLRSIAGIRSVEGNVLTGKLLVVFARDRSADEIAVLVLQQLQEDSSSAAMADTQADSTMHTATRAALLGGHATPLGPMTPASLIYVPMRFLGSFAAGLLQMSPILVFLALSVVTMGQIVGKKEGWSEEDALYFSFVTATTVGYGDLRPTKTSTKALSVGISFVGLVFTGIVAGIGLHSAQRAFDTPSAV